jgi:uncharacterized membrane protein
MSSVFPYAPSEHESEKASGSYLMSLVAAFAGLPLPILNLIATFVFYLGNRRGTYFVRWHCTQALLSQLSLLLINSTGFWWTFSVIFTEKPATDSFLAYMVSAVLFNIIEFIATIQAAIKTRRGEHVEWFLFGPLTNLICKS